MSLEPIRLARPPDQLISLMRLKTALPYLLAVDSVQNETVSSLGSEFAVMTSSRGR